MTNLARAARGLGTALLLFLAWNGISGGLREFPRADTLGQTVQTICQVAYGLLAIGVLVTLGGATHTRRWVRGAWIVAVSLAAGIAPVAWGGTGVATGLMTVVLSATVAWGIVSLLDVGSGRAREVRAAAAPLPAVQSPTVAGAAVPSSTQRSS
jgi:hypothetical protein